MIAKELIIGDYVILKSNGKKPVLLARIYEIHIDGCFVEVFENGGFELCDNFIKYAELEPIVITDEILRENGLELNKKNIMKDNSWIQDDTIIFIERVGYICGDLKKHVYHVNLRHHECDIFEGGFLHTQLKVLYVHQLQNLFYLIGLRNLAVEFKVTTIISDYDEEGDF